MFVCVCWIVAHSLVHTRYSFWQVDSLKLSIYRCFQLLPAFISLLVIILFVGVNGVSGKVVAVWPNSAQAQWTYYGNEHRFLCFKLGKLESVIIWLLPRRFGRRLFVLLLLLLWHFRATHASLFSTLLSTLWNQVRRCFLTDFFLFSHSTHHCYYGFVCSLCICNALAI